MSEWFDTLNAWLSLNPGWLAIALAGTAFLESLAIAGLVIPGVAILFAVAALAGHHDMPVWAAMGWACAGAILGDGVSFWIGHHFKHRIGGIWPLSRYPRVLRRGKYFFRRHGGKSVVLGRFIGPIRPVIPLVAGAFNMPRRRFFLFNVLSAVGWAPLYVLPGFLVGASLAEDVDLPAHFYPVMLVSVGLLTLIFLLLFRVHLGLMPEGRAYESIEAFLARNPRAYRWWRALSSPRGDQEEFPLASLALGLGAAALFAVLTLIVVDTTWTEEFNNAVGQFFGTLRNPVLDPVFLALTLSGDALLLGVGFALFAGVLALHGNRAGALHLIIGGLAIMALTAGFKGALALARPELVYLPPVSPAYPSGHASGSTVLYGLLAALIAREFRRSRRWQIYLLLATPILLITVSRLYLGVHWFTDSLGGVLLGLSVCGFVRFGFSRFDYRPLRWGWTLPVAGLLWLTAVVLYVGYHWSEAAKVYAPALAV